MYKCDICGKKFVKVNPVSIGNRMGKVCDDCLDSCGMCDFCYVFTRVREIHHPNGMVYYICKECEPYYLEELEVWDTASKRKPHKSYIVIGKNPLEAT